MKAGDKVTVHKNVRREKGEKVSPNDLPGFGASPKLHVAGARLVEETAVVEKDGKSPIYKDMTGRERHTSAKLYFNYARNNLNNQK